jgi:hypothetical protein
MKLQNREEVDRRIKKSFSNQQNLNLGFSSGNPSMNPSLTNTYRLSNSNDQLNNYENMIKNINPLQDPNTIIQMNDILHLSKSLNNTREMYSNSHESTQVKPLPSNIAPKE